MEARDIVKAVNLKEAISFWFKGLPSNKVLGPKGKITIKKCSDHCCAHGAIITNLLGGLPLFRVRGNSSGEWEFDDPRDKEILAEWNDRW